MNKVIDCNSVMSKTIFEFNNDITNMMPFNDFKQGIGQFVMINFLFKTIYVYDNLTDTLKKIGFKKNFNFEKTIQKFSNYKIILFYTIYATENIYNNQNFTKINIYNNKNLTVLQFEDAVKLHEYLKILNMYSS